MAGNGLNLIVVVLDSLRQDHVGVYGHRTGLTPHIDALAEECVRFTNGYPEAMPTIPIRMGWWTGQRTLPFRGWEPMPPDSIPHSMILRAHGYTTVLISDTYHLAKPGMNYHQGFDVFRWIRGQEADAYETAPHPWNLQDYVKPEMEDDRVARMVEQYLRNRAHWKSAEDYFAAQTFNEAIRWLEQSAGARQPFFLWVDSFDPHEPWDPPEPYDTKHTDPDYRGPKLIHPKYGPVDWMTDQELEYVRGLYAGEVEFVDSRVGMFLDAVRSLDLMSNSVLILMADHGHPHGDHGSIMKTEDNLYQELLRIPLLVRHPDGEGAGTVCDELVQTHDVTATAFDLLDLGGETQAMHARSFWPLATQGADPLYDCVVTGYHASQYRNLRSKKWSYVHAPESTPNELYDLRSDFREQTDVIERHTDLAEAMEARLVAYFRGFRPGLGRASVQLRYEIAGTPVER